MKAQHLQPGYIIANAMGGQAIVLAENPDPLYPSLIQIIWAVEDDSGLGREQAQYRKITGTKYNEVYLTIDTLDPRQEVGEYIRRASLEHLRALTQGRIWRPATS